MLLPVEWTTEGIARARGDLDEAEAIINGAKTTQTQTLILRGHAGSQVPDVVALYEHAQTVPNSRTPRLLELFAREDLLTPEEIGIELGNGQPLTKAQGRAIVRNLSRMQGHLIDKGKLSGEVLIKDFTGYKRESAGRYGLSDQDRAILTGHLGF